MPTNVGEFKATEIVNRAVQNETLKRQPNSFDGGSHISSQQYSLETLKQDIVRLSNYIRENVKKSFIKALRRPAKVSKQSERMSLMPLRPSKQPQYR